MEPCATLQKDGNRIKRSSEGETFELTGILDSAFAVDITVLPIATA